MCVNGHLTLESGNEVHINGKQRLYIVAILDGTCVFYSAFESEEIHYKINFKIYLFHIFIVLYPFPIKHLFLYIYMYFAILTTHDFSDYWEFFFFQIPNIRS